jgi:hypothetical protein
MTETEKHEAYLGDGVYAESYDAGYAIKLDLRGQDDFTQIYLEPEVFQALVRFAKTIWGEGVLP